MAVRKSDIEIERSKVKVTDNCELSPQYYVDVSPTIFEILHCHNIDA